MINIKKFNIFVMILIVATICVFSVTPSFAESNIVDVAEDNNDIAYKLDLDSIEMIDNYVVAEYAMFPTSDRGLNHIRKLIQNNKTEFVMTRIVFTNTKIKKFQITSMALVDSNGNIIKVLDTKFEKNNFESVIKGAISSDLCDAIFYFLQNI